MGIVECSEVLRLQKQTEQAAVQGLQYAQVHGVHAAVANVPPFESNQAEEGMGFPQQHLVLITELSGIASKSS